MYNFWEVIIKVLLAQKRARITSSLNMQLNGKKFLYVELLTIESLAPNAPKKDHEDQKCPNIVIKDYNYNNQILLAMSVG